MKEEEACPRCKREGTVIIGAKSLAGSIVRTLQCRVCKYSWTEDDHKSQAGQRNPKRA